MEPPYDESFRNRVHIINANVPLQVIIEAVSTEVTTVFIGDVTDSE